MTFGAAGRREEQKRKEAKVLAWNIAALSRQRRLPPLKAILAGGETKKLSTRDAQRRHREHEELTRRMASNGG